LYGRTDEAGYLLISELRGWQRNRLAVDIEHMGPRFRLRSVEEMATPPDRSGALVRFGIVKTSPAVVVLMGPAGTLVPPGSRGRIAGSTQDVIVGFDGEAYVEDVTKGAVIELKIGGVECRYVIPAAGETELATPVRLGPRPCERVKP
jgi:outer membrane usher protein